MMVTQSVTRRTFLNGLTGVSAGLLPLNVAAAIGTGAPVVAAASTMRFCLGEIASAFAAAGGGQLRIVYGSSGNLARQVAHGAPFALFLSADQNYALKLVRGGFALGDGAVYAVGRLALVARKGGAINVQAGLEGLRLGLAKGQVKRFAIANPDYAPYGMRAREALVHVGLWRDLQSNLVLGENVAQAAQFAITGAADGGLIGNALAVAPRIASLINVAIIPDAWHQPLHQRMVLLNAPSPAQKKTAAAFYEFLRGAEARGILQRAGFALPAL